MDTAERGHRDSRTLRIVAANWDQIRKDTVEFLDAISALEFADELQAALEEMLANRAVVGRPRSHQWRFLRDLLHRLLDGAQMTPFSELSPQTAAQYKFEIETRLKRHYLRPGGPVKWVFKLCHHRDLPRIGMADPDQYPRLAGYCLLVRRNDPTASTPTDPDPWGAKNWRHSTREHLEKLIQEAVDAEFTAYTSLPKIDAKALSASFHPRSPAMTEILNVLHRHAERGWVINNSLNPSTKRLISAHVVELTADKALVRTREYWYLRWWDSNADRYTYPYRETNMQMYVVKLIADKWKVFSNERPPPRSSTPHRRSHG